MKKSKISSIDTVKGMFCTLIIVGPGFPELDPKPGGPPMWIGPEPGPGPGNTFSSSRLFWAFPVSEALYLKKVLHLVHK